MRSPGCLHGLGSWFLLQPVLSPLFPRLARVLVRPLYVPVEGLGIQTWCVSVGERLAVQTCQLER
jgi:hypothetical protein